MNKGAGKGYQLDMGAIARELSLVKSPADARKATQLIEQRSKVRADLTAAEAKAGGGDVRAGIRVASIRRYLDTLEERIDEARHYAITGRG